jgi:hypothetical protein
MVVDLDPSHCHGWACLGKSGLSDFLVFAERGQACVPIEVCDADVTYVEEHLDEAGGSTLPHSFWCPWSPKLVAEVTDNIDSETERPRQ